VTDTKNQIIRLQAREVAEEAIESLSSRVLCELELLRDACPGVLNTAGCFEHHGYVVNWDVQLSPGRKQSCTGQSLELNRDEVINVAFGKVIDNTPVWVNWLWFNSQASPQFPAEGWHFSAAASTAFFSIYTSLFPVNGIPDRAALDACQALTQTGNQT